MQLNKLSDNDFWLSCEEASKCERQALTYLLNHLIEMERRQLHLARGFSSLFAYCTEHLKYSRHEAHARIQAARLLGNLPSLEQNLEDGSVSLTVAADAQARFRRAEKKGGSKISNSEKQKVLEDLKGISCREAERKLAIAYPEADVPLEKTRAVSGDLTEIRFMASRRLMEKLERLKNRLAHKNFEGRYDVMFEQLADMALSKIDAPVRRTSRAKSTHNRYVSRSDDRKLREQAEDQCQYVCPTTGKRCTSKHGLQRDHVVEFSKGGETEFKNLQLLCGPHNRWKGGSEITPKDALGKALEFRASAARECCKNPPARDLLCKANNFNHVIRCVSDH